MSEQIDTDLPKSTTAREIYDERRTRVAHAEKVRRDREHQEPRAKHVPSIDHGQKEHRHAERIEQQEKNSGDQREPNHASTLIAAHARQSGTGGNSHGGDHESASKQTPLAEQSRIDETGEYCENRNRDNHS